MNLFFRGMYNINESTAKVVPGIRYKPMKEITLFLTLPMALGDRNGRHIIVTTMMTRTALSVSHLVSDLTDHINKQAINNYLYKAVLYIKRR